MLGFCDSVIAFGSWALCELWGLISGQEMDGKGLVPLVRHWDLASFGWLSLLGRRAGPSISFPDLNENPGFRNALLPLIWFPHTCSLTAFAELPPDVPLSDGLIASLRAEGPSRSRRWVFVVGLVGILQMSVSAGVPWWFAVSCRAVQLNCRGWGWRGGPRRPRLSWGTGDGFAGIRAKPGREQGAGSAA